MSMTMWLALFCLVGLATAIAIKVAAPPASLVAEPAQDQSKVEPAFALNESAKSDRLELPNARAKTEITLTAAKPRPVETPSNSPETVKKVADRHCQNANPNINPTAAAARQTQTKQCQR